MEPARQRQKAWHTDALQIVRDDIWRASINLIVEVPFGHGRRADLWCLKSKPRRELIMAMCDPVRSAVSVFLLGAALLAGSAQAQRNYVVPDGYDPAKSPPFSNGVMVSGTFYVAGHIGLDPATGQAAVDPDVEAHLTLDAVKATLQKGGLTMDDLVSVTIYCTDLSLYDRFNAVYRTYFGAHFPPRAFIGIDKLVRNAHFEVAGVAVKPTGRSGTKK